MRVKKCGFFLFKPFFYPNNNTQFRNCFVLLNEFIKTEWLMGTENVSKASKNYDVFEKNATSNRLFLVLRKNFILLPPGELLKVWSFSFVLVIHSLDGFTLTLKITCYIMFRYTYCFQLNCLTLFYIIWKFTKIYI